MAEKMRYTQDEFVPRLKRYRERTSAEETLLDYFDELEIHAEHIGEQYISKRNMLQTANKRQRLMQVILFFSRRHHR